jgi:hypothetical protein
MDATNPRAPSSGRTSRRNAAIVGLISEQLAPNGLEVQHLSGATQSVAHGPFVNARYLEDRLYEMVVARPEPEHVVLKCPAVNQIDASALESLEAINERLKMIGVAFHLSEVKGPVTRGARSGNDRCR